MTSGKIRAALEADTPLIITLPSGVKVASLAYTCGFNDHKAPPGKPCSVNPIDVRKMLAAAKRAKQDAVDIVVLSLHWGAEYDHPATPTQLVQAKQLLASPDVDLILGDHARVIQPMQKLGDKRVIYCMGNLVARHNDPIDDNREGVLARFTFTEVPARIPRQQGRGDSRVDADRTRAASDRAAARAGRSSHHAGTARGAPERVEPHRGLSRCLRCGEGWAGDRQVIRSSLQEGPRPRPRSSRPWMACSIACTAVATTVAPATPRGWPGRLFPPATACGRMRVSWPAACPSVLRLPRRRRW